MAEIKITRKHNLNPEDLRARLRELEAALKDRFALTSRWEGEVVELKGLGIKKGRITISTSSVELYIQLGLLAGPFKEKLEASIHRHLDRHLGPPA